MSYIHQSNIDYSSFTYVIKVSKNMLNAPLLWISENEQNEKK